MTTTLNLRFSGGRQYDVVIGHGVINNISQLARHAGLGHECVIISDSNVAKLYSKQVKSRLQSARFDVLLLTFPSGERNKSRAVKQHLEDQMLRQRISRQAFVAAFGGGVTGDLAGFIAATYLRGIPYIQLPTSLLAMVDSSVGGKVGVDTPYGKNLVGAFWQPRLVVADIDFLKTLPEHELLNGFAEIIKHATIADEQFFRFLEKGMEKLRHMEPKTVESVLATNIEIKKNIVKEDERERSSRRSLLNFGHTIGHAVEQLSQYKMSHGQSVAFGMRVESLIAVQMGLLEKEDEQRLSALLDSAGFPASLKNSFSPDSVAKMMLSDKKNVDGHIRMALPAGIGRMAKKNGSHTISVSPSQIEAALKAFK